MIATTHNIDDRDVLIQNTINKKSRRDLDFIRASHDISDNDIPVISGKAIQYTNNIDIRMKNRMHDYDFNKNQPEEVSPSPYFRSERR